MDSCGFRKCTSLWTFLFKQNPDVVWCKIYSSFILTLLKCLNVMCHNKQAAWYNDDLLDLLT